MKTTRLLFFAAALFMSAALLAQPTVMPGSIMGEGVAMGPQRRGGPANGTLTGLTLDFRVVTVGNQTWAWTRLHGAAPDGAAWASQLRWIEGTPFTGAMEMNLTGRAAGGVTFTTAPVRNATINPVPISFFQAVGNLFYETVLDFTYDRTIANSADPTDTQAPVLAPPVIVSQTPLSMNLTLSATDNSGHFFFLIEDAANNFRTVSFANAVTVPLLPETQHNFSIWAIDYSGNVSNVHTVSNQVLETPFFTEGQAMILNFRLDSRSLTELVIDVTSSSLIADAFVWLYMNNARIPGEWKPAINVDVGTFAYQIIIPASEIPGWAPNAVLGLNLGFITHPVGDWGHYELNNRTITAGPHTGSPILHRIGTGVDIACPNEGLECENNVLEGVNISLGTPFFATTSAWVYSTNFDATWENDVLDIRLGDATIYQWQAQFPLVFAPVLLDTSRPHGISMNVETNNNTPFYVKIMDDDDLVYIGIPRAVIGSGTHERLNITVPAGLTQITRVLFDFGGNPANTIIRISNITICDEIGDRTSVGGVEVNNMFIHQAGSLIVINSEVEITSVAMFTISGQQVAVALNGNQIDTSALASGVYLLQVNGTNVFRVIVR